MNQQKLSSKELQAIQIGVIYRRCYLMLMMLYNYRPYTAGTKCVSLKDVLDT